MISVLFARKDSIYKELCSDVWDIQRNALNWPGGNALIAHPPCRSWGQLAHLANPREGEKELAIYSVHQIRKFGGILEHPRASRLWNHMNLPLPGNVDEYGGFSLCVNQNWWGHKAVKNSMLYIVGIDPKEMPATPITFDAIQYTVSSRIKKKTGRRTKKEITKRERERLRLNYSLDGLFQLLKNVI